MFTKHSWLRIQPEELYQKTQQYFSVNASGIKKINLNKDDFKTINRHPYLSYELTKSIFDWKKQIPDINKRPTIFLIYK